MSASGSKSLPAIGFLTIAEDEVGHCAGGYLVLNAAGRPLEFHCTAPIKPNRAQEILYGPTLKPYLFGEQIGQTLVSRGKGEVLLVMTDQEPALAARSFVSQPLICLVEEEGAALPTFKLAGLTMGVDRVHPRDAEAARTLWSQHFEGFDPREPFDRIREALAESRKVA